ncbi:hypothetical protein [Acanthopleuribacter pedis]|uniref:Prepilin-type N-terminal cleavage/methylation domain-containing protein n=1 Tax=Acanthopleuribacter pedis TaxID=442870 RepID=A0A8J7Q567_9BACT|nr:hypothetical protein [Acanthopleuribacter pedis]MBO1320617.1 hypothetical protein [Acanthopleuribacter pedis]
MTRHDGITNRNGRSFAFSLIELMVGLLVGGIILSTALALLQTAFRSQRTIRDTIQLETQVQLARDRLQHQLRISESQFWWDHPLDQHPHHPIDLARGPLAYTRNCPWLEAPCLIAYDIRPPQQPTVFSVLPHQANPNDGIWLKLRGNAFDPPPNGSLTGNVAWFTNGQTSFAALIDQGGGLDIRLAAPADQPWTLPTQMTGDQWFIVILGSMHTVHWTLRNQAGSGKVLAEQHWTFRNTQWWPQRTKLTQRFLFDLWTYEQDQNHYLVISTSNPHPTPLARPITVAGRQFLHPVHTAVIRW